MKELSLNLLDIVQNSVKADATQIQMEICESVSEDRLTMSVADNGRGMDADFLEKVCDPFVTSRTTRKVGLGIPLLKMEAESCGGAFEIDSTLGKGTSVKAVFQLSHLDRKPLGDLAATLSAIVGAKDDIRYLYRHQTDEGEFIFDTDEVRQVLGEDIALSEPEILQWISEYVQENLNEIKGGNI